MKHLTIIAFMLMGFMVQAQTVEETREALNETYKSLSNDQVEIWNTYDSKAWQIHMLYKYPEDEQVLNYYIAKEVYEGLINQFNKNKRKYIAKRLDVKYIEVILYTSDTIVKGFYKDKLK